MLRAVIWTLRQRRYTALATVMAIVAIGCVSAGTFEIHRYREKRHDNSALTTNAHAAAVPLTTSVVPLTGGAPAPSDFAILYRTVSVTGSYDVARQQYVGNQNQGGHQGFYVLTPLRTAAGTLLVVRGFVAAVDGTERRPAVVEPPPSGQVRVLARLSPGQHSPDRLGDLGSGEIASINPVQQSARLGAPVFTAYASLRNGQPGTAGLEQVPSPNLDNPSGGAGEVQLLSYVVQWYAFALLALIAPFLFSRAEVREARKRFLGIDPDAEEFDLAAGADRPELAGSVSGPGGSGGSGGSGADVAVRASGALAARQGPSPEVRRRAARLADRYGRSLGTDEDRDRDALLAEAREREPERPARRIGGTPGTLRGMAASDSRTTPHRAVDDHHGSYNDYLWQLALADGSAPEVSADAVRPGTDMLRSVETAAPRVINPASVPDTDAEREGREDVD